MQLSGAPRVANIKLSEGYVINVVPVLCMAHRFFIVLRNGIKEKNNGAE